MEVAGGRLNSLIFEDIEFFIKNQQDVSMLYLVQKWADPIFISNLMDDLMTSFLKKYNKLLEDEKLFANSYSSFQQIHLDGLPQKYFEEILIRLQKKKYRIFFSYSKEDNEVFNIIELAHILEQKANIQKVYFWERDATGSIIEYIDEKLSKADSVIFFYTQHTNLKTGVRMERDMAVYHNKHIIPVFEEIDHVPPIIRFNSGVNTQSLSSNKIVDKIYHLITLKFS